MSDHYDAYSDAGDDAIRDVAKVHLPTRRACWLCSRQLQRMQNGPHKGLYAAVQWEDSEGFTRYAHQSCYEQRPVGSLLDSVEYETGELDEDMLRAEYETYMMNRDWR
jgi:hypothetical protein